MGRAKRLVVLHCLPDREKPADHMAGGGVRIC
jgi:hypothetical protein